jgi:hypothetical protein
MMTTQRRTKQRQGREAMAGVAAQLAALREMTVGGLREAHREVFGEPTRSRNKDYLIKKIAWRIQEMAEGGLSDRALAKIDELAADVPIRWRRAPAPKSMASADTASDDLLIERDPRLPPPGTILTRTYQGVDHKVTVLAEGVEYQGERYASLSQIARAITGTNWNGYLFWGLKRRTKCKPQAAAVTS